MIIKIPLKSRRIIEPCTKDPDTDPEHTKEDVARNRNASLKTHIKKDALNNPNIGTTA
jgi:hypothetical protein